MNRLRIGKANSAEAAASASTLADRYQEMEGYFVARGNAEEAVKLSREGEALLATVRGALEHNDLRAASDAAVSLGRACRSCHVNFKRLS
jgi:cytochrome c556